MTINQDDLDKFAAAIVGQINAKAEKDDSSHNDDHSFIALLREREERKKAIYDKVFQSAIGLFVIGGLSAIGKLVLFWIESVAGGK